MQGNTIILRMAGEDLKESHGVDYLNSYNHRHNFRITKKLIAKLTRTRLKRKSLKEMEESNE